MTKVDFQLIATNLAMNPIDKLVLFTIAAMADEKSGVAHIDSCDLQPWTGLGDRTVDDAVERLQKEGCLGFLSGDFRVFPPPRSG